MVDGRPSVLLFEHQVHLLRMPLLLCQLPSDLRRMYAKVSAHFSSRLAGSIFEFIDAAFLSLMDDWILFVVKHAVESGGRELVGLIERPLQLFFAADFASKSLCICYHVVRLKRFVCRLACNLSLLLLLTIVNAIYC